MTIFHAHLETANFTFDAYGKTASEAAELIRDGWDIHAKQWYAPAGPATLQAWAGGGYYSLACQNGPKYDFNVYEVTLGSVWRDNDVQLNKEK